MRRGTAVLLVILGLSVLAVPVSAQETPEPTSPAPEAGAQNETHERIDNATRLVSASYDEGNGTATVVIESDIPQKLVISDSGAFIEGGVVDQRSVVVTPGERVEITMPVTKADGFVGVSVTTQKTLYAVPLETRVTWFNSESTWQTVQVAALGGAVGVLIMAGFLAWRLRDGGTSRVERIA